MKAQKACTIASALLLLAASTYGQAYTPYFSLVNGSPSSLPGDSGDNVYTPGPTPFLQGNNLYEVDAISGNQHGIPEAWVFSVDMGSVGVGGSAVNQEALLAAPNDQPADIYRSFGLGNNVLDWDGDGTANPLLGPSLGLIEQPALADDVDGLEVHGFPQNSQTQPAGSIYYSLSQASAGGIGFDGATLFMDPTIPGYDVPTLFATSAQLGLLGGGADDIDAAVVYDLDLNGIWSPGDFVDFSLAPGSASGAAADVLRTVNTGGPATVGVIIAANQLGLLPSDNIDALDVIPEPSSVLLLTFGSFILLRFRRLFSS